MIKHHRQDDEERFKRFIESQPGANSALPLTHVTQAYSFRKIINGDCLTPTACPHFEEDLIYLFYGRPAYRTTNRSYSKLQFNWPIIFIFAPDKIENIKRIFPFDSGAFISGLYSDFFSSVSTIEDFRLDPDLTNAVKVVNAFYTDQKQYFFGNSDKDIVKGNMDYEIQGVEYLAKEPGLKSFSANKFIDERASAIEIQVSDKINIESALAWLIMPEEYLSESAVINAVSRWAVGSKIKTYNALHGPGSEAWAGQIYQIVSDLYEKGNYFGA